MKVFLYIFLYLNVSVCSLFFVIWLLTSSPFVETADAADPNPNAIPSVKGDIDVNSPSAVKAATSKSEDSPTLGDVQKVPAEPSPNLQNTAETNSAPTSPSIPPPPPPLPDNPENKDSVAEESPPPAMLENKDSDSAEPIPAPPVPETIGDSDSLTEMLNSNNQFHEDKGSNKAMVKDLMDLNKKVVDIYNKVSSNYQYDTTDKRDPFVPFKETKESKGKIIADLRNCPGQEHNLSDIKLVGIQWGSKTKPSTALFRLPNNESFFLQKNDCLGQSKATIYKIQEGGVVFVEPRTLNPEKLAKDESAFSLIKIPLSRGKGLEVNR